ncbi:flippase [Haloferax sp. Atlit-6N]|uniref:flippase n=1 Tax=Haloferax sp. Atlit-6N TaxID=2077205 RepID=UPI0013144710|nr:flippase [Haloferax sp. Atlit-6N]
MSEEKSSSLASTAYGAAIFYVGRLIQYPLEFIFNIILSNYLGPAGYGLVTFADTILKSLLNFSDLGTDNALMRFIPTSDDNNYKQDIVGLSLVSVLIVSSALAISIVVLSPSISNYTLDSDIFTQVLRYFAVLIPLYGLIRVIQNSFRSLELPLFQLTISEILVPTSRLTAVIGSILLIEFGGLNGEPVIIISIFFVAITLVLSVSSMVAFYQKTDLEFSVPTERGLLKKYFSYSLPLTFGQTGYFLVNQADIIIVSLLLTGSDVGLYKSAAVIATVVLLPLTGLNQIFPPRASNLYGSGEFSELNSFYKTITRWSLTGSLPIVILIVVFGDIILSYFGDGFAVAYPILIILASRGMIESSSGPCGYMLMMTDNERLVLINNWLLGMSNVILNFILIDAIGLRGAAVATLISVGIVNPIRIIEVWYFEGFHPFERNIYKPLVAGGVCLSSLALISYQLAGILSLIFGLIVAPTVYLICLALLGFEEEDYQLANELGIIKSLSNVWENI